VSFAAVLQTASQVDFVKQFAEGNCSASQFANTTDHSDQTCNLVEGAYSMLFVTALHLCLQTHTDQKFLDDTVSGLRKVVQSICSSRTCKAHAN
jgi:hypothetical protein